MNYRPEIDGLRAIAVLAVVIYHCELFIGSSQILPGGYLGVDVFFVISGYLITKIVHQGIEAKTFRYAEFYDRRARRLLPAFITVAIASTIAGYFLLSAGAMREFSGSVLSATGFSSNFYFAGLDDYVAAPSKLRPMLHTWSLAVEEQFYFLLPPLLALFHLIWRKRVATLLLLISLASFGLAVYLSRTHPKSAFYLLPARGWELGLGALIAVYGMRWINDHTSKRRNAIHILVPGVGLFMVLLSILFMNEATPHPSEYTAIAVIGTGLLLIFSEGSNPVGKLLSLPPMRWIGLLSYSFYLWHWPVLVFAKYQTWVSMPSWVWAFISLILCAAAYHLIEKPLRYGSRLRSYVFIIFGLITLVGFHSYSWFNAGIPSRHGDSAATFDKARRVLNRERSAAIRIPKCHLRREHTQIDSSCIEIVDSKPNVLVLGDSLGADLFLALRSSYPEYNFLQFTAAGCSGIRNPAEQDWPKRCIELIRQAKLTLQENFDAIDILVFHGRLTHESDWAFFDETFSDVPILVVGPRYEITPDPKTHLEKLPLELAPDVDNIQLRQHFALKKREERIASVERSARAQGYGYLDINPLVFKGDEIMMFSNDGTLNFIDYGHWSVYFGEQIGDRIRRLHPDLLSLGDRKSLSDEDKTRDP